MEKGKEKFEIITVVPADLAFCWETEVWLENLRSVGLSFNTTVLIGYNKDTKKYVGEYWLPLWNKYLEVNFKFYDVTEAKNLIKIYIPAIRPFCLKQYFAECPELISKTIYYVDSDVIFTKTLDFTPYLGNNIIYASDISSYNDYHYFDSKGKDVMLHKQKEYKNIDVLDECAKIVGITGDIIRQTKIMGGCQYILKNIDASFWDKVLEDCIKLRIYLNTINNKYFPSEEKGFQSWCVDLWVIWWNLLSRGDILSTPKELDFTWATSPVEDWDKKYIYHNAGIVKGNYMDEEKTVKIFNKSDSRFRMNMITPFDIKEWKDVSKDYCNYNYLKIIQEMSNSAVTKTNGLLKY